MKCIVRPDGTIEAIHSDAGAAFLSRLGQTAIRRASHVDSWDDLSETARARYLEGRPAPTDEQLASWRSQHFVDLQPSNGPVEGPFPTRKAALEWEHAWVEQYHLGLPPDAPSRSDTAPA